MADPKSVAIEESGEDSTDQPEVDSLLLIKSEENNNEQIPVNFSIDNKSQLIAVSDSISLTTETSPLISQIELSDGEILLEPPASSLGSSGVQLESATESYVMNLAVINESDSCDDTTKFIDGQVVRLEDGSIAYLYTVPREGLTPVQLEDGTMAYLSRTRDELYDDGASGLDMEPLTSSQMSVENLEDREAIIKMMTIDAAEDNRDLLHKSDDLSRNNVKSASKTAIEKSFRCTYEGCTRVYTTQHHLMVHVRSHTGDRPFKCVIPKCGKAFATGYGLKSHIRVHTGETPYKCNEATCTKAFKTSGDLQKHLRTHTGERPFKCPIEGCTRAFTTSNIRKVHIRTHTGERPYTCKSCGRAFASATNFKNHIRIHTGEKPYVCTFQGCNKKFTEYSSLYKHHVVHSRDKPYSCKICGKSYRQTSTLATHERTSHRNVDKTANKSQGATETEQRNKVNDILKTNILKKQVCFEIAPSTASNLTKNDQSNSSGSEVRTKKLPTIIALQSDTTQLLQEHSPVYAVQLQQDGTVGSAQQILLVTDPTQLAALQQLAQVHLQNLTPVTTTVTKS